MGDKIFGAREKARQDLIKAKSAKDIEKDPDEVLDEGQLSQFFSLYEAATNDLTDIRDFLLTRFGDLQKHQAEKDRKSKRDIAIVVGVGIVGAVLGAALGALFTYWLE